MSGRTVHMIDDDGFGLVEVIIAMFLLAVIAVVILPAMWNGIRFSSQQSSVATATRQLNGLVEQARQGATCAALTTAAASRSFTDGSGRTFTTSGPTPSCTAGAAVPLTLTAVQAGTTLATVNALVYVPAPVAP